jgi:hypothetical protein
MSQPKFSGTANSKLDQQGKIWAGHQFSQQKKLPHRNEKEFVSLLGRTMPSVGFIFFSTLISVVVSFLYVHSPQCLKQLVPRHKVCQVHIDRFSYSYGSITRQKSITSLFGKWGENKCAS